MLSGLASSALIGKARLSYNKINGLDNRIAIGRTLKDGNIFLDRNAVLIIMKAMGYNGADIDEVKEELGNAGERKEQRIGSGESSKPIMRYVIAREKWEQALGRAAEKEAEEGVPPPTQETSPAKVPAISQAPAEDTAPKLAAAKEPELDSWDCR